MRAAYPPPLPGGDPIDNAALLIADCDVLTPAALEQQITVANAERVRAQVVVEGANGPTTPEADAILAAREIRVVPDILANAGGVVVSYVQRATRTPDGARAFREIIAGEERGRDLRTAALVPFRCETDPAEPRQSRVGRAGTGPNAHFR